MSAQEPCSACHGPRTAQADENIALGPEQWDAWHDDIWAAKQSCAVSPVNGERYSEADGQVAIPPESPPTPATQSPTVESNNPRPQLGQATP